MFAYRIGFRFFAGINQHKTGTFILPSPFRKRPLGSPRSAVALSQNQISFLFDFYRFPAVHFCPPDEKRVRYAVSARTNPPPFRGSLQAAQKEPFPVGNGSLHEKNAQRAFFLKAHCAEDHTDHKKYGGKDSAAAGFAGIIPPGVPDVRSVAPGCFPVFHAGAQLEERSKHCEQTKQSQRDQL